MIGGARIAIRHGAVALVVATALACVPAAGAATGTGWSSARVAACAGTLDASLAELDRTLDGPAPAGARSDATSAVACLEAAAASAPAPIASTLRGVVSDARGVLDTRGPQRAAMRGAAAARVRVLAASAAVHAASIDDPSAARAWLTLRERRPATRLGVPEAPAAGAVAALESGQLEPAAAARVIRTDVDATALLVLRSRLQLVAQRSGDGLVEGASVAAAAAAAGWDQFDAATDRTRRPATRLAAVALAPKPVVRELVSAAHALDDIAAKRAAEVTLDVPDATRAAARLTRFVELVPIEYGRGVRDGRVSLDLEIQEARSFLRGALGAWTELEPFARQRDELAADAASQHLQELDALITRAEVTPEDVAATDDVEQAATSARTSMERVLPDEWLEASATTDLELVRTSLASLAAAVRRGRWIEAERARVEAYGAFEFGPELRLRAIDPSLALRVEELVWFGDGEHAGLATLVAGHAADARFAATLDALDTALASVETRLGDSATPGAIRTNAAIIVLREGMEAVLILAALTAGLQGSAGSRWRRPILVGGLLALVATAVTFVLAQALLGSLARFGEKLEVIVSLVAIAVLLLILNWFVHKAYWTGWMANFQRRKVAIAGTARARRAADDEPTPSAQRRASAMAQLSGLLVLGFTSIYREGFETVLFLQALVLDAGQLPVLEGAAIGMVGVGLLAVLTIRLQRRLPYRRMLIVTGMLIAIVLAAMVGGTTQGMQAVGWLSVHPIGGLHVPGWAATWLGVHPTWEAVGGQFAAVVFVLGSYVVAEWWQERKRLVRRVSNITPAPIGANATRPVSQTSS